MNEKAVETPLFLLRPPVIITCTVFSYLAIWQIMELNKTLQLADKQIKIISNYNFLSKKPLLYCIT